MLIILFRTLLERWLLALFLFASLYRIYACFQVPLVTTDVIRNLGYASHALENNFAIYNTLAIDFNGEIWSRFWSNLTYPYPPVTLLFFYIFSIFNLGIFWVKLTLSFINLACAYLFYKKISKVAAILVFCAPISLWYTSHEGQFEALQTLFIILNAITIKNKHWRLAVFFLAISIQVKQMGLLIAPWMLYKIWRGQDSESLPSVLGKATQGLVLGFFPFLGYYLQTPYLLLQPFLTIRDIPLDFSNPFAWRLLNFYYVPLIVLVLTVILGWNKIERIVSVVPLGSFWCLIKSLKVARVWYTIVSPGFLFCFPQRKKLICLLLVLHIMENLSSVSLLVLSEPFGFVDSPQMRKREYMESKETRTIMESCMFKCNMKQTKFTSDITITKSFKIF
jgi:hypothetical protein